MIEEKELTDDKLVKALEICSDVMSTNYDASKCKKCPYFLKKIDCVERSEKDWLGLIHRLQDENERMTEEIDQRRNMMQRMDCNYATELKKNAELQKQVDELKEERQTLVDKYNKADEAVDYWCEKYKQAVKDTAKEILQDLYKIAEAEHLCGLPNPNKGKLPSKMLKVWAKERYGVEVE